MYQIIITGYDWESCYLHQIPSRKQQVLDDLQKEIDELGPTAIKGDTIVIDVLDHSIAMEMFDIVNIDQKTQTVEMTYNGGIS